MGVLLNKQKDEDDFQTSFEIQNVVASVTLGQKLDLEDIKKAILTTQYNPDRFPGLVYRLKRPNNITTLIFSSGKKVCTGAKSEKQARSVVNKVVRELKNNGIIILNKPKTVIVNMVASGDLGLQVDLEIAADVLDAVMYEPEQFPGMVVRMSDPKVVFLVFATGKCVCTGAKSRGMVGVAMTKLFNEFDDFDLFFSNSIRNI